MSERGLQRRVNEAVLLVPRRAIGLAVLEVVVVLLLLALVVSGALGRATTASTVADRGEMAVQQAAAERDVERAYELNVEQVRKGRSLKLPVTAQQADAIATKALADLRTLRHSAFLSLGQALGPSVGDPDRYTTALEQRYDAKPVSADPSPAPVLLAPRLYAIVGRMSDLAGQLSDRAIRDLTQPGASATPAPSPSVSPRPSPTPTR